MFHIFNICHVAIGIERIIIKRSPLKVVKGYNNHFPATAGFNNFKNNTSYKECLNAVLKIAGRIQAGPFTHALRPVLLSTRRSVTSINLKTARNRTSHPA